MAMTFLAEVRHFWLPRFRDLWSRSRSVTSWWVFLMSASLLTQNWPVAWICGATATLWLIISFVTRYRRGATLDDHVRWRWERDRWEEVNWLWTSVMVNRRLSSSNGHTPQIVSGRFVDRQLWLDLMLPIGISLSLLSRSGTDIAEDLGLHRIEFERVQGNPVARVSFDDPLTKTIRLSLPETVLLDELPMGLTDTGEIWHLAFGPHTLVAGSSGAGKASVQWSYLAALAPAIHKGLVEVHGIDLKGGMEFAMGRELFARFANDPSKAVQLLEGAVEEMRTRSKLLAGSVRQHTATNESPHIVVMIDELAAVTAYITDRDLQRRANTAISLLCSQGRAVGVTVFAALQDPRKEVLPARGLFLQTIGLRLASWSETDMVLGQGARERGALCHEIPVSLPGTAFVVPAHDSRPVRVRAGFVDDDSIRQLATTFPAPNPRPIPDASPDSAQEQTARSRRRSSRKEKS